MRTHLCLLALFTAAALAAQDQAPAAEAKPAAPANPAATLHLADHIHWLKDGTDFYEGVNPVSANKPDRMQLVDDACKQAKAENKLVLWYVHRIQEKTLGGRQMYRAPVLDLYMQQVLFADQDVSDLIESCFVPLRCVCDQKLSDRFELKPLEFIEPAVVFLDGDGKVVHFVERIRTFSAHWFLDLCTKVLHQAQTPRKGETAAELRKLGLFKEALQKLGTPDDGDGASWLQVAQLQRLLRQPDAALAALLKAETAPAPSGDGKAAPARRPRRPRGEAGQLLGDVQTERGRVLAMMGKLQEAQPVLEQAWRSGSKSAADAGYIFALDALRLGDEISAMRRFQLVAQKYPDTLSGRKARANTLLGNDDRPFGAAFTGFESFGYLPESAYQGMPKDTEWHGPKLEPKPMARQALLFLLAQQHDDGGFTDARYAYWPDTQITPNVWVAITAIACTALLEYRYVFLDLTPRIDEALRRGERYISDDKHLAHGQNEECYSDAYRLLYFARKTMKADPAVRQQLIAQMNELAQQAAQVQKDSGFFAHEYENAFCTGAVLWGVLAAKGAGATVPPELTDKGAAALLSARTKQGGFTYGGAASNGQGSGLKDASARMPVCEGALFALGRSDPDKVKFALDNFWQYMKNIERVRRNDFHSDGELGGFFFFHGVFHASEVVKLLPEDQRGPHWQKFVELLQQIPEMDGSFLDSHELGRSYGTAMALLTLKNATTFE